jgi:general secretion pathway protein F
MTILAGKMQLQAFRYRSTTASGVMQAGEVLAVSAESAVATIRERGEWPIEISSAVQRTDGAWRMSARELGTGFRVLATILEARVPVGQLMRVAAPSLPFPWKRAVSAVTASLDSGESFSAAIRIGGVMLPTVVDGLLRAGEAAGDLSGALRQAAELTEKSAATRSALIDALAYPLLLTTAGAGVIGILVAVVIPRFTEVLTNLGQELPTSTRVVLGAAALVRNGIVPGGLCAMVFGVSFEYWRSSPRGRHAWHAWLLSLPIVGGLRHAFATARVTGALAALIDCGMPVARALPFAAASSGDAALEVRLLQARQRIVEGQPIARALEETHSLTASATQLIGAGEAGGALSALLRHAAALESERAGTLTKSLMRVIEPALILILGAVVSGVAIALLQAVYSVRVDRL